MSFRLKRLFNGGWALRAQPVKFASLDEAIIVMSLLGFSAAESLYRTGSGTLLVFNGETLHRWDWSSDSGFYRSRFVETPIGEAHLFWWPGKREVIGSYRVEAFLNLGYFMGESFKRELFEFDPSEAQGGLFSFEIVEVRDD